MTVYIDSKDSPGIAADVTDTGSGITYANRRWFHLIADTKDELHAFAARVGMQRRWFQDPVAMDKCKPGCRAAENWHYDLTQGKMWQAVRLGAVAVTPREMSELISARYAATQEAETA